jgi:hypothetical protein
MGQTLQLFLLLSGQQAQALQNLWNRCWRRGTVAALQEGMVWLVLMQHPHHFVMAMVRKVVSISLSLLPSSFQQPHELSLWHLDTVGTDISPISCRRC